MGDEENINRKIFDMILRKFKDLILKIKISFIVIFRGKVEENLRYY